MPCSQVLFWYHCIMSLLPVAIRRRLRSAGFTEPQTEAIDEASEATAEAAREGLARDERVNDQFGTLRSEMQQLRSEMLQLRSDMNALAWRLFAALVTVVTAGTAAIMTAIAVWG